MGKLLPMLLLIFAIYASMIIFLGITPPLSSLWVLLTQPENWSSLALISIGKDAITVVGLGIVIGSFWTKSDTLLFSGLTAVFLSFGIAIAEAYLRVVANPQFNQIIGKDLNLAVLMFAPLLIAYFYIVLSFWRGRD